MNNKKDSPEVGVALPQPCSAHAKAWEKGFIVPIAKEMKARGVAYLMITIRSDGKAAYVLDTVPMKDLQEPYIKNCRKCFGQGQVEIQSGPYTRECPDCKGSGKQNSVLSKSHEISPQPKSE